MCAEDMRWVEEAIRKPARRGLRKRLAAYEEQLVFDALVDADGNVTQAARRLRVSRQTLYTKMERLGIDPARVRQNRGKQP